LKKSEYESIKIFKPNIIEVEEMEAVRPLTPPKSLFYDPRYSAESDPEYKAKLESRRITIDNQRETFSKMSQQSSQNNFEDHFNIPHSKPSSSKGRALR